MIKNKESIIFGLFTGLIVIFFIYFIFGYYLPTMDKLDKIEMCISRGYFSYDKEKNTCWDRGHINVDSFECVKSGKCSGSHLELAKEMGWYQDDNR